MRVSPGPMTGKIKRDGWCVQWCLGGLVEGIRMCLLSFFASRCNAHQSLLLS